MGAPDPRRGAALLGGLILFGAVSARGLEPELCRALDRARSARLAGATS